MNLPEQIAQAEAEALDLAEKAEEAELAAAQAQQGFQAQPDRETFIASEVAVQQARNARARADAAGEHHRALLELQAAEEAERERERQAAAQAAHAAHVTSLVARGEESMVMFLGVLDALRTEPEAIGRLKQRLRALNRSTLDAVALDYEPAYFAGSTLVNQPRIELEIHRVLEPPRAESRETEAAE